LEVLRELKPVRLGGEKINRKDTAQQSRNQNLVLLCATSDVMKQAGGSFVYP
jgi:hypothetical protein